MSIFDFKFRRYLGADVLRSNGVEVQPRDVVGLMPVNEGLAYIASTRYPVVDAIDGSMYDQIMESSRAFTADPGKLFGDFDFTLPTEGGRKSGEVDKPQAKPVAAKPKPVKIKTENETREDEATRAARQYQQENSPDFGKMRPLEYATPIYSGGSMANYSVKKLPRCGKVALEIRPISELQGKVAKLHGHDAPDYVMQDIQDNVMPALGLKIPLPFKRLYFGITSDLRDGTHIVTYRVSGILYGAISVDPKQLIALMGGFNSASVAHATTHELAHFIDHTMIRNVDRMRFEQAIRGKKIHPDTLRPGAISTVPAEHFATLAELMVWGNSLRRVYTLNGIEIVEKYFENRYIPQADIDSKKI